MAYTPGYDSRERCPRCDFPSWSTCTGCIDCGASCCSDCAESVEDPKHPYRTELRCSQCCLERALEAVGEDLEEVAAEPGMAAYKLVPPMQGHLFPEADKRKPMRVEVSRTSEGVA